MKTKYIVWKSILLFIFITGKLHGQIYCQGSGCSLLPISDQQLQDIFTSLRYRYLNEVMMDMSTATSYSVINTFPGSMVNLKEFTLGASATVSETQPRKIDIPVPGYGVIEDAPSKGVALIPNAFLGFNVGYIFSPDPKPLTLPWYSPYRFDILVGYLSAGTKSNIRTNKKNDSYEIKSNSGGISLRYHLFEGDDGLGLLFKFLGVSLGFSYYSINQSVYYLQNDSRFSFNAPYQTKLIWKGNNIITFNNKAQAYSADIRTGIQLLYLFRLAFGFGHSWLGGLSKLQLNRYGPVIVENDILKLLNIEPPDASLGVYLDGTGKPKRKQLSYIIAGVEINIPLLKIFVEAKGSIDYYSGSVGFRLAL